ncbi:hypothetical protein TNCV_324171 [Trichonephila clavipes]|nr:hypothetical protein TNCV_324171 [Trichonephila clavipes]
MYRCQLFTQSLKVSSKSLVNGNITSNVAKAAFTASSALHLFPFKVLKEKEMHRCQIGVVRQLWQQHHIIFANNSERMSAVELQRLIPFSRRTLSFEDCSVNIR